jgi:hypothetical protein
LARRIEYTYSGSSHKKIQANVQFQLDKALNQQSLILKKLSEQEGPNKNFGDGKNDEIIVNALSESKQSLDEILKLFNANKTTSSDSTEIVEKISASSIASNSVTLVQTFPRPVAVGYRYVALPSHVK